MYVTICRGLHGSRFLNLTGDLGKGTGNLGKGKGKREKGKGEGWSVGRGSGDS